MKQFFVLVVAACLTQQDIDNAECRTFCRMSNYDSGFARSGACWCADKYDQNYIREKKLKIGGGPKTSDQKVVVTPYAREEY